MKPVLLDLFCCAGGASVGYDRAGFRVVGVDNRPQPNYPFEFILGDALTVDLYGYDAFHASPPCQGYSPHVSSASSVHAGTRGMHEPQLIDAIRDRLIATGKPYVIENVMGAKPYMRDPIQLCGTMFDLPIARHRLIETSFGAMAPYHPKCNGVAKKFAAERGWEYRDMSVTGKGRHAGTSARWGEIMGIDWHISQHEFREAIPPAYSDCIGRQMVRHIPMIDLDCENCAEKIS